MSLLKNIWRPDDESSRKNAPPPGDAALTERLAELLGRELSELEQAKAQEEGLSPELRDRETETDPGVGTQTATEESLSIEISERGERAAAAQSRAAKKPAAKSASGGTTTIARATEEAMEQLRATQEQIESSLRNRVEDYGRAIEAAMGGLERGIAERPVEDATAKFRTEAREWFDEARQELSQQLDLSRTALENELRSRHAELLESAKKKIEALAVTSIETTAQSNRQDDQQRVERWLKEQGEASRQQMESGAQRLAQATEEAMARLRQTEERIQATFQKQVEEYRRAVEQAASQLEEKGISQAKFQNAAEELQRLTDQVLERSSKRIEMRAEEMIGRLGEKLSAAERSLSASAKAAIEGALEEQQRRIGEQWLERAQAAIEEVRQAGEKGRAQLDHARGAITEEFRKAAVEESRRVVEEAAAQLRSGEFRDQVTSEARARLEQTARELLDRSSASLGTRSERAVAEVTGKLEQAAETFLGGMQERLETAGRTWLESAGQQVQQDYQVRISQWLEQKTAAIRRQSEEAGRAAAQHAEQAAARLSAASEEAEAALRKRIEDEQQRWIEAALDSARKRGFDRKAVEEALGKIEESAKELAEQANQRFVAQAEASRAAIARDMEGASRTLLEGVEASLENISWKHRGRLAQWWEERSQTAHREAESATQAIEQAVQQASSQLRNVQSEIEEGLRNRAREHQMRLLDSAMEEMRRSGAIERAVNEATTALRTNANEVLARSAEQIREHAEAARLTVENQALASRRSLGEEMARKAEQAQASVEAAGKAVTEDYRRQLSVWWEERTQAVRRESEEALHSLTRSGRSASEQIQSIRGEIEAELRASLESYRQGLREAATEELRRQGFQKDMLETIGAELDKTSREMAERSTKELQRHIDNTLNGLEDKMKSSRQNFLDDTQKQLTNLTQTSIDMATTRFHELLSRNAADLEREQEEWLQRKREAVWLDINRGGAGASHGHAPFEREREQAQKQARKKAASSSLSTVFTLLGVVVLAAALTVLFVRMAPKKVIAMELKNDPPAGFIDANPGWGPQERARQLQLAHAYWMIGINDLEHQYPYNTALPATPPAEFRVDQVGLKDDAATRMIYWNKFRALWTTPSAWQQVNVSGNNPISKAIGWLQDKLSQPQQTATAGQANP